MDKVFEWLDFVVIFNWFWIYLILKLESFKDEILVFGKDIDNIIKFIKKEVLVKFKYEGNKIQYNFKFDLLSDLVKVQKYFINKLNKRNKLIRIVDKFFVGWIMVIEYESDYFVLDFEDGKCMCLVEIWLKLYILIKYQLMWIKELKVICVNKLYFGNLLVLINLFQIL